MIPSRRQAVALLAFSLVGLTACHKPGGGASTSPLPSVKLDGPALATVVFTGDGWGEYAPCG